MPPERSVFTTNGQSTPGASWDVTPVWGWNADATQSAQMAGEALRTDAYRDSVAFIKTNDGKNRDGSADTTGGTGFFISRDGLLATDYHVVRDADSITVTTANGVKHKATIVGVMAESDLALLKVEPQQQNQNFIPVELAATSSDLKPTDELYTRGHPRRSEESVVTTGSGVARSTLNRFSLEGGLLQGENPNRPVIVSRVEVETGSSGGPIVRKSDNKVVGVVGFDNQQNGGSVSTPVEDLHQLIAKYRETYPVAAAPNTVPSLRFTIADLFREQPANGGVVRFPISVAPLPLQRSGAEGVIPSVMPNATDPRAIISRFANIRTLPRR